MLFVEKMSKKSPPPRPPAPKMSSGGGLSFSYKALEEEDDEELIVFTGKFDKKVNEEKEKQSKEVDRPRSASKSPDSSIASEKDARPTVVMRSQYSFDKLKDFTGKVQERITKKIEDFATDQSLKSKKENETTEDKSKENTVLNGNEISIKQEKQPDTGDYHPDSEFLDCKGEDDAEQTEAAFDSVDDLEINEHYYDKDSKDFSDLPFTETEVRQRKRLNKSVKIKPIKPEVPVSMSNLSQKQIEKAQKETIATSDIVNSNTNYNDTLKATTNNVSTKDTKTQFKKIACIIIFIFLYIMIPLPSYINGMIAGILLSSGAWLLYLWVTEPPKPREPIPDDLPLDKLPPMPVPAMKEPKVEDHGIYKGWMNEIMDYVPETYSINHTHSVFVHLEGTTLRLRRPKTNVPKRAMWDEPTISPQFIHQRHFDLKGSKVLLLPPGLVKKRLWSKKYPICVALAYTSQKPTERKVVSSDAESSSASGALSTSHSADSVNGFEVVQENKCDPGILYLFARTCHEKETWFRRLSAASKGAPLKNHILEINRILNGSRRHRRSSSSDSLKHSRQESLDSVSSASSNSPSVEEATLRDIDLKEFVMYMARLLPKDRDSLPSSPAHMGSIKEKQEPKVGDIKLPSGNGAKSIICDPVLLPINALLGRCFWDFLRDTYWSGIVKEKLQKKLSKIHIPYFIEELQISDIDLGTEVPVIRRANKPYLDENGFWVDLDLTYGGKFKMTIETKVNLLKLKEKSSKVHKEKSKEQRSAVTDSEEEDSAESSTDEEEETGTVGEDGSSQQGTGKRLMKYINKITASKYFQSATENKYIKKAMTEVSNTRLILTVEVQKLNGTLAINIPVPPSDRLWYGFRGNPQLWLVAKPKVGEREVTMSHITEWIEKKLTAEFQHVLVMPNMDDLVIPILLPDTTVAEACSEPHPYLGSEV